MPQGLETVFLENREPLLRFLRARGAGEQADDLVQEVWLRASGNPSGPVSNPRAYLFRIAHNLMIDGFRADTQRTRREQNWSEAVGGDEADISPEPSPERVLVSQDMLQRAQEALDALGEPTPSIFRRFRLDGIGQRTIAAEFGVSLATVEKHLQKAYRAMAALKREFDTE